MDKLQLRVAAVVVTYNRLNDLKECISALRLQTYKCYDIIVVNNGSTDGTTEYLAQQSDLIVINQENCGGAGGFYSGMKYMLEHQYDALWMMDDDGLPKQNQLDMLIYGSLKYGLDYANALVIDKNNHAMLSSGKEIYEKKYYDDLEIIPDKMCPFNGTFVSRKIIEQIGLIKREMFIWGDEREYTERVRHAGFKMGIITKAIHYHPCFKGELEKVIPFCNKWKIAIKPEPKDKIYFRNIGYIDKRYGKKNFFKYCLYYLIRLKFQKLNYFYKYYTMGKNNDFSISL